MSVLHRIRVALRSLASLNLRHPAGTGRAVCRGLTLRPVRERTKTRDRTAAGDTGAARDPVCRSEPLNVAVSRVVRARMGQEWDNKKTGRDDLDPLFLRNLVGMPGFEPGTP